MKLLEVYLITLAWAMIAWLWYVIVYNGFTAPPQGKAADVLRTLFRPIHLLVVWNPYPPTTQSRISSLMHFASRNPKRAFKLITARNDIEAISSVLNIWSSSWPLDAELSVLLFHWLKSFNEPVGQTAVEFRQQPCMRLVRALTDASALAVLVPDLFELVDDPSSPVSRFDVEYGIASSRALSPSVVRAMPCHSITSIFSYARPNYHGLDPLAEIFPQELPQELDVTIKRVCALLPYKTFGEVEAILRDAIPTQPGWSLLAADVINSVQGASYSNTGFPEVIIPELLAACAPLRELADSITAVAGLKRAGAPGDLAELALIASSLEFS